LKFIWIKSIRRPRKAHRIVEKWTPAKIVKTNSCDTNEIVKLFSPLYLAKKKLFVYLRPVLQVDLLYQYTKKEFNNARSKKNIPALKAQEKKQAWL
jgi:hypothetical protein